MTRILRGSAILMFVLLAFPANAQSLFCTEPVKPYCVDVESIFERDVDVERCRQDVEVYLEAAEEYGQCLRDKAEAAAVTAKQIKTCGHH